MRSGCLWRTRDSVLLKSRAPARDCPSRPSRHTSHSRLMKRPNLVDARCRVKACSSRIARVGYFSGRPKCESGSDHRRAEARKVAAALATQMKVGTRYSRPGRVR